VSYFDSREVPDGAELETDICIIGGGAAGISMAAELVGSSRRVILLESGGLTLDPETQSLYNGENIGFPYYPPSTLRLRFLGGTTNHWAGACKTLDAVDFEQREWVPLSGWPIGRDELEPYYHRAHEVCDLGPMDYDPARWQGPDAQPLDLDPDWLKTRMYQVSPPTRFASKYGPLLEQQSNVSTYLHGNAMMLHPDESGAAIRSVTVACLQGTQFRIRAGKFVLAMGALENTRFLLHCMESASFRPGPWQYWVGRCFMEHLSVVGGTLLPADDEFSTALYGARSTAEDHVGFGVLAPSPRAMERERMLQARVSFAPTDLREGVRSVAPGLIGASVAAQSGQLFEELGQHVRNIMLELDDLVVYSYENMFRERSTRGAYYLQYMLEQSPDPESRVTLGDTTDQLGMKQLQIAWRFGELEKHTLRSMNTLVAAEMGAAGIGRVWETPVDEATGWPPGVRGSWHQMGTTRMSADPAAGVVNGDCLLHGTENVYVTGSSVFTTSGKANPTLTIVALALRLADHLKGMQA
jgi:choline dehydrogenase-like flavoprotein